MAQPRAAWAAGPLDLALHPPVYAPPELAAANGLAAQGNARRVAGTIVTVVGLVAGLAGALILADLDECVASLPERDSGPFRDDPRQECKVGAGMLLGMGGVAAGVGGWLWYTGDDMEDRARAQLRPPQSPTPVEAAALSVGTARRAGRPELHLQGRDRGASATLRWRF